MSISSINYGSSLLGQSVQNINTQLTNLSTQLSSGVKSTDYAGMGVNEGFAIAARAQLANITAFGDTMTNVTTTINAANTVLQSLSNTAVEVQSEASATPQNLTSTGQTIGQQNALSQLSAMVGMLNTQVGDRYIFSGSAINTPAVVSADDILNGNGTQAGLKQVIADRQQADLGTNGLGRLVLSQPTATSVQVAEDVAGSPFGLKLNAVSSSLTNATVTGPSGSPAAVSIDMTAGNPQPNDQINFTFNEPDGATDSIQLTATNTSPPPTGSFTIGATPAATAANLNAALNASISTLANTSLLAASAVAAGNDFFNTSTAIGNVANNKLSAPITGGDGPVRAHRHRLAPKRLFGRRHHHREWPDDHLRGIGRERQQPDQHYRQRSDVAFQNRRAHRHVDAVDRHRRRSHAERQQCIDTIGHKHESDGLRRAGLSRRAGDRDAAAGFRLAARIGDVAGQRFGQHRAVVHRQLRSRIGTRVLDRTHRFLAGCSVRRPGQRTGDSPGAAIGRNLCRGIGVAERHQFAHGNLGTQPARRGQPDAAAGPADDFRHPDRFCDRANRDEGCAGTAEPDPDGAAKPDLRHRGHRPEPGRKPDPAASDQSAGLVSDHRDALAAQPREVPAAGLIGQGR